MGAEYLSYVKSIATFAPTFYGHIISVLASVHSFWSGTCIYNFLPLISIQSPEKSVLPAVFDVT